MLKRPRCCQSTKVVIIMSSRISGLFPSYLTSRNFLKELCMIDCTLSMYISHTNLLYPLQHGFQPGHSTAMSLVDIQDNISKAMDNNEFSIGIFLDLAKAFDTVDHKIHLDKLEHYGIRDTALKWFN